jgi:hypothetical protein
MNGLPDTEQISMREIDGLKQEVSRCPHCGALQRNNGVTECYYCLWMGCDPKTGRHGGVARNDEHDLDRQRSSRSPEHEGLSWSQKIGRFAQSLWQNPKKSLIILLQHERSKRWRMGTLNEQPAMEIHADFYLTNITQEDLFVLKTFFIPYHGTGWFPSSPPVEGNVVVKSHIVAGGTPRRYKIPPGFTYEGHADWWIQPSMKREGESFRGRGCFIDQFDNEHWTPVLTWEYR